MSYFESEATAPAGRSDYQLTPIRVSLGRKGNEEDGTTVTPKKHDLLSFMSLIVVSFTTMTTDIVFLNILLDGDNFDLPDPSAGQFFSVVITKGERVFERLRVTMDLGKAKPPELVALKTPIMTKDTESPRNQRMLSSMATELQILRHRHMRDCENIVDLLGVCWQRLDASDLIVPAFVLECAELGDLDQFVKDKRVFSRSEMMQLCIGIAAGVNALHEIGVVHCDLKPRNILVFKHESRSFIPKIADFGSSFLLSSGERSAPDGISPRGTRFFQAPEWQSEQGRPTRLMMDQLMATDIWSLGFILWGLMKGWAVFEGLEGLGMDTFEDFKRSGALLAMSLRTFGARASGEVDSDDEAPTTNEDEDEDDRIQQIQLREKYLMCKTLDDEPSERWNSKEVLQSLREIHSLNLQWELVTSDVSVRIERNELEQDVMMQPDLDLPSEEDEDRIWSFAQAHHLIDSIGADMNSPITFDQNRENPAVRKYIQYTLDRWEKARRPPPQMVKAIRDGHAVVESSHSMGTMRLLPRPVRLQLLDQLHLVALEATESKVRRSKAAFENAYMVLSTVQDSGQTGDINKALEMLVLAAHLEHEEARSIVGWLFESFDRPMPIDPDLELEWTRHAAERGSRAAEQRLRVINQKLSIEARQTLRDQFGGFGYETKTNLHPEDEVHYVAEFCEDPSFAPRYILHYFATVGHGDSLKSLVHSGGFDINERIETGETPLLQACRSGHAHIIDILIEAGADASIGSNENIQSLHFLSSFDDHDIPRVAKLLKNNGSDVHARTNGARVYSDKLDSRFGREDGTPLLWAVIADCTAAVTVLLELGADPFDAEGRKMPVADNWGDIIHRSPVDWAAWNHQYNMLELLIPEPKWPFFTHLLDSLPDQLPKNSPRWQLNNSFRAYGTQGTAVLPLMWAIEGEIGLVRRMFYHGPSHKEACLKTVDLLLRRGADPRKLVTGTKKSGMPITALDLACQGGQTYLVEFLLDRRGGMLRPGVKEWCNLVTSLVAMSDRVTFQLLMKYRPSFGKDESQWIEAILRTLAEHMDEVDFLSQLTALLVQTNGGSRPDFSAEFEIALHKGNFKAARFFFENGTCDLVASRENETVLGRLIMKSKHYRNVGKKIEFFLSLIPDTDLDNDRIFWNAGSIGESHRDLFTAIQLATLHTEFRRSLRSDHSVLQVILERFHEPRYLNAQVAGKDGMYTGFTALHLAVAGGNIPAADMLLQQADHGLDINKLNAQGESPVDVALLRMRSGKRDLEFWDIEERDLEIEERRRDERTTLLISHLHKAGAKHHRYSQVITRTEERKIFMLNMEEGSACVTMETPEVWPPEALANPLLAAMSRLEVGHSFFISRDDNLQLSSLGAEPSRFSVHDIVPKSYPRNAQSIEAASENGNREPSPRP